MLPSTPGKECCIRFSTEPIVPVVSTVASSAFVSAALAFVSCRLVSIHRIAAAFVVLLGGCFGGAHGQYPLLSHRTVSPLQMKTPLQYDHIDGPTQAKF